MYEQNTALTGNFKLAEFFVTHHDPTRLWQEFTSLSITEQGRIVTQLILLANRLQVLRDILNGPIWIESGWRSQRLNQQVGGAPSSFHQQGMACDLALRPGQFKKLQGLLQNWSGGLGIGNNQIHLDIGPKRRWTY